MIGTYKEYLFKKLSKFHLDFEVISDFEILVTLLYIKAKVIIHGDSCEVVPLDKIFSKNHDRDLERLQIIVANKKKAQLIPPINYEGL